MTRSRTVTPLLFGAAITLAAGIGAPAQADELRIGFIAPMTGSFSQVGKDMVNGFQMYLDEHKGKGAFGGAAVKFIVEDNQAKGDAALTKERWALESTAPCSTLVIAAADYQNTHSRSIGK